ncbi:MAG: S41 family peptidase [Azospirillaceae bacterium]|nr:S41 family peptidase [Azospirillaceae bacterium]
MTSVAKGRAFTKGDATHDRPQPPYGTRRGSARRRAFSGLALLLLIAGCAAEPPSSAAHETATFGEQVFAVALGRIDELALHKVDLPMLAVDGLNALHHIDDRIGAEMTGRNLRLTQDGRIIGDYRVPTPNDAPSWASLIARAIDRARATSPALQKANSETIYQTVFDGITADLDPYSRYTGPTKANADRALREGYGGIGLSVDRIGADLVIHTVIPNTPASRAGLAEGDILTAIDGVPTDTLAIDDVHDRLRGIPGSTTALTLQSPEQPPGQSPRQPQTGATRIVVLRRERIITPTVTVSDDGPVITIKIDRFNAATSDQVRDAVKDAGVHRDTAIAGAILDLRGNPGGLLDQAIAVTDLFVSHGRLAASRGRHPDSNQNFDATDEDMLSGLPMVALIDNKSASAAEIVAAALEDSGRAVLVGSTSFGKGSVQTVTRLPNDGELFVTWARLLAPSGYTLNRQGVVPEICTSGVDADTVLERLRDGGLMLPAALTSWRMASPEDEAALTRLRDACPWRPHDVMQDVRVARQILLDPALYRQAVTLIHRSVAER